MRQEEERGDKPWLSIITIIRNDPEGFTSTRNSLARQNLSGVEWVIVDSSDETVRSLASIPEARINFTWLPPKGIYPAMNEALKRAQGTYAWFMNAGDEATESSVSTLRTHLEDKEPEWLIGQVSFIDEQGKLITPSLYDHERESARFFAAGRFPPHQGTVVCTEILRKLGGFNTTYRIAADYQVILQLAQRQRPWVLESVLARFSMGGISTQEWFLASKEFHRARKQILAPNGLDWLREWAWTIRTTNTAFGGCLLRRVRRARAGLVGRRRN